MSPSTLIWNSPLPAEWPTLADSLKVKNYKKNTQQIIFFISRKINTNILGPNFFEPKLSPAQKNLNQVYPAACASSELLRACLNTSTMIKFYFKVLFTLSTTARLVSKYTFVRLIHPSLRSHAIIYLYPFAPHSCTQSDISNSL